MKQLAVGIILAGWLLPGAAWAAPAVNGNPSQEMAASAVHSDSADSAWRQIISNIAERRLDNGIPVYIAKHADWSSEKITFVFSQAGCVNDPPGKYGLAAAMIYCLAKGDAQRGSKAFAEAVKNLGIDIGCPYSYDTLGLDISCKLECLPAALDLTAGALMDPAFAPADLEAYQQSYPQSYAAFLSSGFLPELAYRRLLYGEESRYGTFKDGLPDQVVSITRQDVLDYYCRYITPDKMTVFCFGGADPDAVTEMLNKRLGKWSARSLAGQSHGRSDTVRPLAAAKSEPRFIPADTSGSTPMEGRLFIIDTPGAAKSFIRLGYRGTADRDLAPLAVDAMNKVLGGGASSRLAVSLSERSGYTDIAVSGCSLASDAISFSAATGETRLDKTIAAAQAMLEVIDSLHQPVSEEELQKTLEAMAESYEERYRLIRAHSVISYMQHMVLDGCSEDYEDAYVSRVLKLTPADIKKAADRILDNDKMIVVIVGDAKVLEPQLKEAGWRAQVLMPEDVVGTKMTAKKSLQPLK